MWILVAPTLAAGWQATPGVPLPAVRGDDASAFVVLATEVPAEWGTPDRLVVSPRGVPDAGLYAVAGVPARGLPAELEAWRGRRLSLASRAGACEGTVGELLVVRRQSWMEGYAEWTPGEGVCAHWSAECDAAILAETLNSSPERLLVGRVAGCTVGAEEVVGTTPEVQVAWASPAPPESPRFVEGMRRLRETPTWQAAQAAWITSETFLESTPDPAPPTWGEEPRVWTWTLRGRTWVGATDRQGGCGYFEASVWAVWEVETRKGREVWKPLRVAEGLASWDPSVLADPDGDGVPMFVSGYRIVAPVGGALAPVADFAEPWNGCGC